MAPHDIWLLRSVLSDTADDGIVFNRWNYLKGSLLMSETGKYSTSYLDGFDNLLLRDRRLYLHQDGTGRIYEITHSETAGIRMIRLDSTVHTGYNFSSIDFVYKDTIYSAGGYGIWARPGHLRYYNENSFGWEIMPINTIVNLQNQENQFGYFVNQSHLYFVTIGYPNEALKHNSQDPSAVVPDGETYRLSLASKDWEHLGTATPEFLNMRRHKIIAFSPWGPLIFMGAPLNSTLYLLDYEFNLILEMKDKHQASMIIGSIWLDNLSVPSRVLNYWKDSALIVLSSEKTQNIFHLKRADFSPTEMKLYEPKRPEKNLFIQAIGFFGITLLMISGLFYYFKRRNTLEHRAQETRNLIFDEVEIKLIRGFLSREKQSLLIEEVDELLETTKKSKDVQNQRRSAMTRSINQKYNKLSGDNEKLIEPIRMEADRRTHCYLLHADKYNRIARWVDPEKV